MNEHRREGETTVGRMLGYQNHNPAKNPSEKRQRISTKQMISHSHCPQPNKGQIKSFVMIREMVNFACQSWFAQCTLVGLLIDWVGCHVISAVLPSRKQAEGMCCRFCHLIFQWFLIKSCPWVRVTPPLSEDVARLLDRDRVCLLMNHTSFFDSVLFVGTTPPGIIWRYRTLMKRGLFDVSSRIRYLSSFQLPPPYTATAAASFASTLQKRYTPATPRVVVEE